MDQPNLAPAAEPAQPIVQPELQPDANAAPVDGGAPVDSNAAPEGDEPAPQPQPDKRSAQYRFSELTSKARQAEIRAERAEAQLEVYRNLGITPPGQQPNAPQAPTADGPPSPEDYYGGAADPQFIADNARFAARQVIAEEREAAARQAEFQSGAQRFFGVMDQAEAAAEESEDFADAPKAMRVIGKDKFTADTLTAAENPIHIAAYLGAKPQVLKQIMAMPLHQRAMQIGKIDQHISAALKASSAPAPAAPAPAPAPNIAPTPTPILPNGRTPLAKDPSTMSVEQFAAWRASGGGA